MQHDSLADIPESELVRRLLADSHWRERFFRIHGIPKDPLLMPEVPLTGLGAKGDIDVLALDAQTPEQATAIQIKRVKVPARAFRDGRPNKLAALSELHRQSTLLIHLGFHQVFSYAIVVIDSREHNSGEYTFDGLTGELRAQIEAALTGFEGLHHDSGFLAFELCQPIDDMPLSTGTFSGHIYRMPRVRQQSSRVTAFVRRALAASGA